MPHVIVVNLNMDNPGAAARNGVSELIVRSLRQGDNAFVHCMAGIHRAALAGCMLRALLHDETLDEAISTVKQVRHVEPQKCLINHPRCRGLIAKGTNAGWMSRPAGWAASTKLIHAVILVDGSPLPACQWNQGGERTSRVSSRFQVYDKLSALGEAERGITDICLRFLQKVPAAMTREAARAGFVEERTRYRQKLPRLGGYPDDV